ncbi:MAG: Hsp20/alpha crystallin family protein [Candidatus Magnetoovum sp. WYHC-5]|nr:Hsp20/alpha crystallin family protein [Candidatus Magnetoovum sp. WYHC-5]
MLNEEKKVQKKEVDIPEGVEHIRAGRIYSPVVDIVERNGDVLITADMPGVDKNSVDITLEKNVLTIYGYVTPEVPEGFKLAYEEYGVGDYKRSFTLSDEVARDKIEATIQNGVLTLVLPKAEAAKTRKIEVK